MLGMGHGTFVIILLVLFVHSFFSSTDDLRQNLLDGFRELRRKTSLVDHSDWRVVLDHHWLFVEGWLIEIFAEEHVLGGFLFFLWSVKISHMWLHVGVEIAGEWKIFWERSSFLGQIFDGEGEGPGGRHGAVEMLLEWVDRLGKSSKNDLRLHLSLKTGLSAVLHH